MHMCVTILNRILRCGSVPHRYTYIRVRCREGVYPMKKTSKQILLVFLAIAMVISVCSVAMSCSSTGGKETDNPGLTLTPPTTETTTAETTASASTTTPVTTEQTTGAVTTAQTTSPVVPQTGTYINPLTGLKTMNSDPSNQRPVAVVIDNIQNAYTNQKGLYQADILYEMLVAPGITRYLAVIEDYANISEICNVRSGRDYHIDLAASHNAILVCHGGSNTVNYDFFSLIVKRLGNRWAYVDTEFEPIFSWADYTDTYGTIKNRKSRTDISYDTLVNGTALKLVLTSTKISSKFVRNGGKTSGAPIGFSFGTSSAATGSAATSLEVKFTMSGKTDYKKVGFAYDSKSGKYIRSQSANTAGNSGETLSFTNVLLLGTTVKNAKTGLSNDPDMALVTVTGSGSGYYFCGGKAVKVAWSKTADGALKLTVYGTQTALTLSAGNTYVGYVESSFIGTSFFA